VGRKVLLIGWQVALPIPAIWCPELELGGGGHGAGYQQELTWSMAQTSSSTSLGWALQPAWLNEFAGYGGAGPASSRLSGHALCAPGPVGIGLAVIGSALLLTNCGSETPAMGQGKRPNMLPASAAPRYPANVSVNPRREITTLMSWRDKRLMALSQAGLVEKFVDALVGVYPVFLYQQGVSLTNVGWIIGV
jgi:hypothetical protein